MPTGSFHDEASSTAGSAGEDDVVFVVAEGSAVAAGDGDTFDDLDFVGETPGVAGTVKNVVVFTLPGLRATFFRGGDAGEGELAH